MRNQGDQSAGLFKVQSGSVKLTTAWTISPTEEEILQWAPPSLCS